MPDQQQPNSSAQASSSSSNAPAGNDDTLRIGKVSTTGYEYYPNLFSYITIIPADEKGPLNDKSGNPATNLTRDLFGGMTDKDHHVTIKGEDLMKAVEENRQQAIDSRKKLDYKDSKQFFLQSNDLVHLEYSNGKLTAVKKINKPDPPPNN